MADISEKIAKAEEEIRQLRNKKRKLLNQQKAEERKARTRRLIERGAILESFLEQPEQFQDVVAELKKDCRNTTGRIKSTEKRLLLLIQNKGGYMIKSTS